MNDLRVTFSSDPASFDLLRQAWEDIHGVATTASIFTSWIWQRNWWRHYGRGRSLCIAAIEQAGNLVGIGPFYIESQQIACVSVRILRFIGIGGDTSPDDLDPLLLPGLEDDAAEVLVQGLLNLDCWDALHLSDMSPDCPFTTELARAAKRLRLKHLTGTSANIWVADLRGSFDSYLQSISSGERKRIQYRRRRLHNRMQVQFFICSDENKVDQIFDKLVELHHKRWSAVGSDHAFRSTEYVSFHRDVIRECLARDWVRLYCLQVGADIVAIYYVYRHRNRIYLMQGGFEPALADHAVGGVLMAYAIEAAIAEGNTEFDFLRGQHRYKAQLSHRKRSTLFARVYRRSIAGIACHWRFERLPRIKARTKSALEWLRLRAPSSGHSTHDT